jgi:hypothetical protein
MDETKNWANGAPAGAGAPGTGAEEGRLRLIGALQAQALAQPEPRAANLQALGADLLLLALKARQMMEAALAGARSPAAQQEQFARHAELYLKLVRQFDRVAQLARRLPGSVGREAPPG